MALGSDWKNNIANPKVVADAIIRQVIALKMLFMGLSLVTFTFSSTCRVLFLSLTISVSLHNHIFEAMLINLIKKTILLLIIQWVFLGIFTT
jgi:hypothetical protein